MKDNLYDVSHELMDMYEEYTKLQDVTAWFSVFDGIDGDVNDSVDNYLMVVISANPNGKGLKEVSFVVDSIDEILEDKGLMELYFKKIEAAIERARK